MKYKTSDVSKILDIPIDTLRFLESKSIVKPEKNNDNNYREYEAWDINFLTEYKKFKGFEFSLHEIAEIMHQDDLECFVKRMDEKQDYYAGKQKYYTYLARRNNELRMKLKTISECIGNFRITQCPDMYYFLHRFNEQYETKDKFDGIFEKWLEYFPFIQAAVIMKQESIENRKNNNDHFWGFLIEKEYLEAFQLPLSDKVKHITSTSCLSTVICAGEKGSFSLYLLEKALEFIDKNGYELVGDVIGNLLARTHETKGYSRYIEVWIPIKKR